MQSDRVAPWKIRAKTQPTREMSTTAARAGILATDTTTMSRMGTSSTGFMKE